MTAILVAMTDERVIGRDGGIPWHLPEDMKLFRDLTMGNTVVMGRKTYQSIGKPLHGRLNIVISSTLRGTEDGIEDTLIISPTFDAAFEAAALRGRGDIFVIGGAEVYRQALPATHRMYISLVDKRYQGDTFFPPFNETEWILTRTEPREGFVLAVYDRNS